MINLVREIDHYVHERFHQYPRLGLKHFHGKRWDIIGYPVEGDPVKRLDGTMTRISVIIAQLEQYWYGELDGWATWFIFDTNGDAIAVRYSRRYNRRTWRELPKEQYPHD